MGRQRWEERGSGKKEKSKYIMYRHKFHDDYGHYVYLKCTNNSKRGLEYSSVYSACLGSTRSKVQFLAHQKMLLRCWKNKLYTGKKYLKNISDIIFSILLKVHETQ